MPQSVLLVNNPINLFLSLHVKRAYMASFTGKGTFTLINSSLNGIVPVSTLLLCNHSI